MVYLQLLLLCASFLLEHINCQEYGVLDCKWTPKGTYYRGSVNRTSKGNVCQHWDAKKCDDCYEINRQSFPYAGLDANYCRNPEGDSKGLWCYIMTKKDKENYMHHRHHRFFDYCNIPDCTPEDMRGKRTTQLLRSQMRISSSKRHEATNSDITRTDISHVFAPRDRVCLSHRRGREYRGPYGYALTADNLKYYKCMKWEDLVDAPIRPNISRYKNSGLQGRTCRNPNNIDRPWCYISAKMDWDYCTIRHCMFKRFCTDFGNTAKTRHGHTCAHWSTVTNQNVNPRTYPDAHLRENYCRNPDRSTMPWCYYKTWKYEYCNIPECPED